MIKIQTIEEVLTFLKSSSLVRTRSFIKGPSPAKIPFSSYFLIIVLISFTWLFNSSVAIS